MANFVQRLLQKAIGIKSPVPPAMIDAIARPVIPGNNPDTWMSPNQPLFPQQPQVAGRQFDYPVGVNLQYTPRGTEQVSFSQLRALADSYDLLRILIETRKDQLVKFQWQIDYIDQEKQGVRKTDPRCIEISTFLKFPDRRHNWQTWLRALVEDMLVLDAATIYPRQTRGGKPYSLDLMDGATLKVVIDESGRQPDPPLVAYQQILKGIPAVDYHADELLYLPRNVRTNRLYGYSPVEQIIMTVNIAMRRQIWQLQKFTEGNIPEALVTVPASWNPDQIAKYQQYWDSLIEGNTGMQRHIKFIPDGQKYYGTKPVEDKNAFDEWLARICCFAFSIPPTAFVKEMNRATSESAKEAALEEGLIPLMSWIKDSIDLCIWRVWGYDDLEFQWQDEEPTDPLEVAQMNDLYIKNGTKSVDEVRQDLGLDGIGMKNAIYTGQGPILIEDVIAGARPTALGNPDANPSLASPEDQGGAGKTSDDNGGTGAGKKSPDKTVATA